MVYVDVPLRLGASSRDSVMAPEASRSARPWFPEAGPGEVATRPARRHPFGWPWLRQRQRESGRRAVYRWMKNFCSLVSSAMRPSGAKTNLSAPPETDSEPSDWRRTNT